MSDQVASKRIVPKAVSDTIEEYTGLNIGGKRLVAPYFMNTPGRKGRRVSVGKGKAKELERETMRLAKKHNFDLASASAEQIRDFMVSHQLGIDCSGFVAWASHAHSLHLTGKSLSSSIIFKGNPLRVLLAKRFRPIENVSARLLTDDINADTINDVRAVLPGDIIRTLNGNHVLLIVEVGYTKRREPMYFKYVNSTEFGGVKYGVRYGLINITDGSKHLLQQEWIDGENGVNWTFNNSIRYPDDTRVVRLKAISNG